MAYVYTCECCGHLFGCVCTFYSPRLSFIHKTEVLSLPSVLVDIYCLSDCLFSMLFCFSPPSAALETYFTTLCPLWSFHPSHCYSVSLTQWSLAGHSFAPWVHLAKSRDILGSYSQGGSSTDISRAEVKDTDKNHTVHGIASLTTKDNLAPNFNSTMVEKFCSNLI